MKLNESFFDEDDIELDSEYYIDSEEHLIGINEKYRELILNTIKDIEGNIYFKFNFIKSKKVLDLYLGYCVFGENTTFDENKDSPSVVVLFSYNNNNIEELIIHDIYGDDHGKITLMTFDLANTLYNKFNIVIKQCKYTCNNDNPVAAVEFDNKNRKSLSLTEKFFKHIPKIIIEDSGKILDLSKLDCYAEHIAFDTRNTAIQYFNYFSHMYNSVYVSLDYLRIGGENINANLDNWRFFYNNYPHEETTYYSRIVYKKGSN